MIFHHHLAAARDRLVRAGIDPNEATLDSDLLAREIMRWTRAQLLIARHAPAPAGFAQAFDDWVARREKREPMAYIIGHREFWKLDFEVSPAVLIPRPETELLVEQTLAIARRAKRPEAVTVADIGTGSGCIAVSLARELPDAVLIATDVSAEALELARRNARRHSVESRIQFVEQSGIPELAGPAIVVSNPPYVPLVDRGTLPPEVRDFEPPDALFAGRDGLDIIRSLVHQAGAQLSRSYLLFEIGFGQDQAVRQIIEDEQRFRLMGITPDLQGIPRVAVVRTIDF